MKDNRASSADTPRSKNSKKPKGSPVRWAIIMLTASFCLSVVFNAVSETALTNVSSGAAFIILAAFILLGIVFDALGVATTIASEKPFHAMSSKRISGAREALWLVKNAEKVSSFCNDVVGDICGIMSGSTAAVIIATLPFEGSLSLLVSLFITGMVAGVTVGGKAFGKVLAMRFGNDIVFFMARFIKIFKRANK